jgi:glycine oxidase
VVGAGIIGLASAFRLARAGHSVLLFDPHPAHGATWAAAGMLAPSAEVAPGEESNYALQKSAIIKWHELADELSLMTGRRLCIHETGTLLVGLDASDRRMTDQFVDVARDFGVDSLDVTRDRLPDLFRAISPRISSGTLLSGDAWIDPDEAVSILSQALDALGVRIITEEVLSITSDRTSVSATTGSAALPGGAVISGQHTVRPVHGVTLRVQGVDRSALPIVRAFVRGRNFYMVSRPGGYCVLGATLEERAEPGIQVGELARMLRDALDIVPELETATVLESRFGLRPASQDLRPFFEVLANDGWAWSSGHYRHGVTLAPLAAQWALDFVEAPA